MMTKIDYEFTVGYFVLIGSCQGYNLGYDGKQAIHPNQVSVIYECYRPPEESIAFAKKIVEANVLHQQDGKGAFEVDGKMIDMPMVSQKSQLLSSTNII
jgi:citrate lyase subunit beta-like protein